MRNITALICFFGMYLGAYGQQDWSPFPLEIGDRITIYSEELKEVRELV